MRAALTFAIVSLAVGLARGGEPESNFKHLRELAYFIGEWEMTGEVHWADRPVEAFVIRRTFAWTLGRNFIEARMIDVTGGANELRHKSMIGWDKNAKSIKEWGFWNQKTPNKAAVDWEVVTWTKDGKQWRIERDGLQSIDDY